MCLTIFKKKSKHNKPVRLTKMIPNLSDYQSKKTKGLVSIQKIDDENFAVCEKKYDLAKAAMGDLVELPAEVKGVTMSEVNDEIARASGELKTKLADLEAFKKDLLSAQ